MVAYSPDAIYNLGDTFHCPIRISVEPCIVPVCSRSGNRASGIHPEGYPSGIIQLNATLYGPTVREEINSRRITQRLPDAQLPELQLPPGVTLVNRYLIQDVVGIGGMGSVYRARDLHFPNVVKLVAVKEMINQARDPQTRESIIQNFEREADILVTLNHPAIPRIYDYFTQDERSYLVLEYIPGKDLEAILNETGGFLRTDQVIAWAIQLCDVLEFLAFS